MKVAILFIVISLLQLSLSVNFNLVKGNTRIFRANIIAKEDLILQANFGISPQHSIIVIVRAGTQQVIFNNTYYQSTHIKKTIPNPYQTINPTEKYYFIEVKCESQFLQPTDVWNIIYLKTSSDFKQVINHNIKKQHTRNTKQKRKAVLEIKQFAEGIGVLAKQHQTLQSHVREEENQLEKKILQLTDNLSYLLILEIVVISLCALLQVISFRSYLISKHIT